MKSLPLIADVITTNLMKNIYDLDANKNPEAKKESVDPNFGFGTPQINCYKESVLPSRISVDE